MRVVFDTNVLVAASRSVKGASFALVSSLPSPKFELAISLALYLEYLDVLLRPEVKPPGLSENEVVDFVRRLTDFAHPQEIFFRWRPWLRDPKDDMILELAVAAQCLHIVTFNLRDFTNVELFGIDVVTPATFYGIARDL